jgi:HK97 family phage major capsid protein
MSGTVSLAPKGLSFARYCAALAHAQGRTDEAADYAARTWGHTSPPAIICRAAASPGTIADATWGSPLAQYQVAAAEFVEALRPRTVLGRLTGVRRVPLRTKIPRTTAGSTAQWVGEQLMTPVSVMAFDTITLDPFKISGIVVSTAELVKFSQPGADALIREDLLAGCAKFADTALLDPALPGETGVSPASITNGATTIVSSGSTALQIASDLKSLFNVLADAGINFIAPYLICSPRTAIALSLKMDTAGVPSFPGVTAAGGVLAGVPLLVSANLTNSGDSPLGSIIVLVDAAELIVGEEPNATTLDQSTEAMVQLSTTPDSPPAASTLFSSLWQLDLQGWRVVRTINWKLRRSGAVAMLTGVNY